MHTFSKKAKVIVGNYSQLAPLWKIMKRVLREHISVHMKVVVTGNSQHGFTQSESCLTNLMAIYDKIIGLVEKRRPVDAIHLDFSKAFNAISHNIPVSEYTEDGWTTIQETKWLGDGAQRVVVNGLHSTWTSVTSGVPQGSILEHNLCNIFANNLKEATECPLVRFVSEIKLGDQLIWSKAGLPFRETQPGWRNGLKRILSNSTWTNGKKTLQ